MFNVLAQRLTGLSECPRRGARRVGRCRWRVSLLLLTLSLQWVLTGSAGAQVAAVPAPAWATTAVRGPLALGPGNALYASDWWRFAVRSGGSVAFDGAGATDAAWPVVDGAVEAIASD